MRIDLPTARYLVAALTALEGGQTPPVIRQDCPRCGRHVTVDDPDHVVADVDDLGPLVLVGCDGYLVIDPSAVGSPAPTWQPSAG